MLVEEADRSALKDWVIPKLEKISDADAGVLADYVIALVVADDTEDAVRRNCLESLSDFLQDHTAPFIDEVLAAVKSKSFLPTAQLPNAPSQTHSIPTSSLSAEAPPFNPPTGPAALVNANTENGRGDSSRKRRYNERETSQPRDYQDSHYKRGSNGDRPRQMARRGGKNGRGGYGGQDVSMGGMPPGMASNIQAAPLANFQGFPAPPPGFPAFDPRDPMSFLAMMGMAFPGLAAIPPPAASESGHNFKRPGQSQTRKGRCRDYDTKGFCALGSSCPYEHGGEIVLPPTDGIDTSLMAAFPFGLPTETLRSFSRTPFRSAYPFSSNRVPEYDPTQAALAMQGTQSANHRQEPQGWSRSASGVGRGPRARAAFSQAGPNFDHSRTSIVVEQIPEEYFSEEEVRKFFSQFGNILEVDMRAYKRLAIVKYDDYWAARRAYDSPKVIFDNRFVKVYWYKPESLPGVATKDKADARGSGVPEPQEGGEETVDAAELEKRQADAQKAFEERQRKAREADAQFEELERKLRENEEQARVLREELAKRSGKASNGTDDPEQDDPTLIDKLAILQAEAQNLNADYETYSHRGRGRGTGYRGRGFMATRGRGYYPSFRGGYRGRASYSSPFAGGRSAVKRLDNRPKRVAVSGVKPGSAKDEALRQHLTNGFEYESIDPHPDSEDAQIITFKERYMAEMFLDSASNIPDVGKIELSWVPNATAVTKPEGMSAAALPAGDEDTKMEDAHAVDHAASAAPAQSEDATGNGNGGEADYDVADDEDRWMAT